MGSWAGSTHRAWLEAGAGPEGLGAQRARARARCLAEARAFRLQEHQAVAAGGPGASAPGAAGAAAEAAAGFRFEPLTEAEERALRRYHEGQIAQLGDSLQLKEAIRGLAALYFKRFYLRWSVMDHDPARIVLACVYLACKVEDHYVGADEFGKVVNLDAKHILNNELVVLEALGFDLLAHVPSRMLYGFCQDFAAFLQGPEFAGLGLDPDALAARLHQRARGALAALMLTDAPLLFPPGLVALAALRSGARSDQWGAEDGGRLQAFLGRAVGRAAAAGPGGGAGGPAGGPDPEAALRRRLGEVDRYGVEGAGQTAGLEALKEIDRKLRKCRNPRFDPTTATFKAQRAAEKQQKQQQKVGQKKAKRTAAAAAAEAAPDPDPKRRRSDGDGA